MPLYEYRCRECGNRFEALVRDDALPRCPACNSAGIERMVSQFAVKSAGTTAAALRQARAKILRTEHDKAVAQSEYEQNHRH